MSALNAPTPGCVVAKVSKTLKVSVAATDNDNEWEYQTTNALCQAAKQAEIDAR